MEGCVLGKERSGAFSFLKKLICSKKKKSLSDLVLNQTRGNKTYLPKRRVSPEGVISHKSRVLYLGGESGPRGRKGRPLIPRGSKVSPQIEVEG